MDCQTNDALAAEAFINVHDTPSKGLSFNSLPQEIRAMVFDFALVGVCPLRHGDYVGHPQGLSAKKQVDQQIIDNVGLLAYGRLPTLQLTHEARDLFWERNCFETDFEDIGSFALGFGTQLRGVYILPLQFVRNMRVDIYIDESMVESNGRHWLKSPRGVLRQLLDFPALRKIEVVLQKRDLDSDSFVDFGADFIKHVGMKLMKKFGEGFAVFSEISALPTWDEPYPWETRAEVESTDDGASQEDVEDKGDDATAVEDLSQGGLNQEASDSYTAIDPSVTDRGTPEDDGKEEVDGDDDEQDDGRDLIMFQREDLTWLWRQPTKKTLEKVGAGRGDWLERINVELFDEKMPHPDGITSSKETVAG